MLDEELYNRICNIFFQEEVRLQNEITDKMNFIIKYAPTDAHAYIELAQAKSNKEYFDKYVFRMLDWLRGFVQDEQTTIQNK